MDLFGKDNTFFDFHTALDSCSHKKLGAVFEKENGVIKSVVFRTFVPEKSVKAVFLTGDFNLWNETHPMQKITDAGIYQTTIEYTPNLLGTYYKYKITTDNGDVFYKEDPYGVFFEKYPKTASVIYTSDFSWTDGSYLENRKKTVEDEKRFPLNVYELHCGTWKRNDDGSFLSYCDIASELIPYLKQLGYTHVKLLSVTEHSSNLETTGFFAPTSRYGTPDDFRFFVNEFHKAGLGVIADIDFSQHENISFVASVLDFWIEEFHLDGICVFGQDEKNAEIFKKTAERFSEKYKDVLLISQSCNENLCFKRRVNREYPENFIKDKTKDLFPHKKGEIPSISRDTSDVLKDGTKDMSKLVMTYMTTAFEGKITFMGSEAANSEKWDFSKPLLWQKLFSEGYGHLLFMRDLNRLYLSNPVLWDADGFVPISCENLESGVFSFARINDSFSTYKELLVVFNTSQNKFEGFVQKLPKKANCTEIFSTNKPLYGATEKDNKENVRCDDNGFIKIDLQPYTAYVFEMNSI